MSKYEKLSYCGVFCGTCANFKQNMNCQGCRNEPSMVDDCPTRTCAVKRGLLHCGECGDFPCQILNDFYNDGNPMHLTAFNNMREIVEKGADDWLIAQGE